MNSHVRTTGHAGRKPAITGFAWFVGLAAYIWLVVDPVLQHHATELFFFFGGQFLSPFLSYPGGLRDYAARFLAQSNHVGWLGALLLAGALLAVVWLSRFCFRRIAGVEPQVAHYVPASLLLLLANGYDYPVWQTTLEVALGLSVVAVFVSIPLRTGWLRLPAFWVACLGVGYGAGIGACLLFALLVVLNESLGQRRHGVAMAFLGSAAAGLVVACVWFELDFARSFSCWGKGSMRWLTIGLYAFFPVATLGLHAWHRREATTTCNDNVSRSKRQRASYRTGRLKAFLSPLLLVVSLGVAFLTFDANTKAQIQVDYCARQGQWGRLLEIAPRLTGYRASTRLHINRALFHTGRMASDMFAFRQSKGLALLPGLDEGRDPLLAMADTLLDLGAVNLAEQYAHETLESHGDVPEVLQVLACVNVLKGRPEAARVFLNLLGKMPFHASVADRLKHEIEVDPTLSQDPEICRIRRCVVTFDYLAAWVETEMILLQLLEANRHNRMAFEYLMAHYLLQSRPDLVVKNLNRLRDFDCPAIPRHYEEAALLHLTLARDQPLDLSGWQIRPQTIQRYKRFRTQLGRFQGHIKEGKAAIQTEFGDTYWSYYFFAPQFTVHPWLRTTGIAEQGVQ